MFVCWDTYDCFTVCLSVGMHVCVLVCLFLCMSVSRMSVCKCFSVSMFVCLHDLVFEERLGLINFKNVLKTSKQFVLGGGGFLGLGAAPEVINIAGGLEHLWAVTDR